jgi:hypothetical protein
MFPYALVATQIEQETNIESKLANIMESLKEGVKFVFNNKTILGALSLDMIAVLLVRSLLLCCPFLLR